MYASEKKRRKRERGRKEQKTRIVIGNQYEIWRLFKKEKGLLTDRAVAQHLLDNYGHSIARPEVEHTVPMAGPSKIAALPKHVERQATRTPSVHVAGPSRFSSTPIDVNIQLRTPSVSEVSSQESSDREKEDMSGVEPLVSSAESDILEQPMSTIEEVTSSGAAYAKTEKIKKSSTGMAISSGGRNVTRKQLTDSFIDRFNLSIEISDEKDSDEEDKDEDYESSFCFTAVLHKEVTMVADDVAFEEVEFNLEADDGEILDEAEDGDNIQAAGITVISSEYDCRETTSSVKCFISLQQLLTLASYTNLQCTECKDSVHIEHSFIGSALYMKWICGQKHVVHQWCSQPQMNRKLHTGDFLICSTILSSGNNFSKMLLWAKQLNLMFPSSTRFHGIQRCYMLPAVESAWNENLEEVRSDFHNQDIILMGDGRNDSRGHSAQYCSYTFMEYETKKILALHTIDKRQTERKSVNMEKRGFIQALNEIRVSGLSVKEVVTDAHFGISCVMRKEYPEVKHSYAIWHVAKHIGKKIVKASQKKQNMVLMQWSRDIINHFWFSCQKAESYSEFLRIWRSVLHHITNQHEWIIPDGGGLYNCLHETLNEEERDKPWLHPEKHSQVLKELANIILDKRLLKNVEHFLNFRSTSELEGFHQHILMYCAKRLAYTPPVYRARNLLAALDHNKNADRGVMKNKDGSTRYHRTYNKKSGRWSVYACREPRYFGYIQEVLVHAMMIRLIDPRGMYRKVTLEPTDVRLISKTIAPVEPPLTERLVQEKKSRYN